MDFAKQELINIRALLIEAIPYEENKVIGKLYTRELGLISALWNRSQSMGQQLLPPVGLHCQLKAKGTLYFAQSLECIHFFETKTQNFPKVWWTIQQLIKATQSEEVHPTIWDLLISILAKEKQYEDWRAPLAFATIAIAESIGFSIEELFVETLPHQIALNEAQKQSCLNVINIERLELQNYQVADGLLEKLIRFIGMKCESEICMKYCERGDLNPHEETLTTTSK